MTKIPLTARRRQTFKLYPMACRSFAPCNIRCNAIAPGFFVSHQNRELLFDKDGAPTERTKKILAATPQKRFGEVSDLIGTLLWLASDAASGFVTGSVIAVDGGFAAYSGV